MRSAASSSCRAYARRHRRRPRARRDASLCARNRRAVEVVAGERGGRRRVGSAADLLLDRLGDRAVHPHLSARVELLDQRVAEQRVSERVPVELVGCVTIRASSASSIASSASSSSILVTAAAIARGNDTSNSAPAARSLLASGDRRDSRRPMTSRTPAGMLRSARRGDPDAVLDPKLAFVGEMEQRLAEEERVAVGLGRQQLRELRGHLLTRDAFEHGLHVGGPEPVERDARDLDLALAVRGVRWRRGGAGRGPSPGTCRSRADGSGSRRARACAACRRSRRRPSGGPRRPARPAPPRSAE